MQRGALEAELDLPFHTRPHAVVQITEAVEMALARRDHAVV